MTGIFIVLLVLILLAIAAFSGNDRRYRRRDDYYRYDDYDPYYPQQRLPMGYPPPYPQQRPFMEPIWGNGYPPHRETSGLQSLLGFVLVMVVGLLGYLAFSNSGAGGARGRPDGRTEARSMNTMNVATSTEPATRSVFPREQTALPTSSDNPKPSRVYTVDLPDTPAGGYVNEYDEPVLSSPPAGNFYIQTGSFSQLSGARTELDRLARLLGKPLLIHLDQTNGWTEFKLLVGPFASRDAASQYKKRNLSQEHFVKELSESELNQMN